MRTLSLALSLALTGCTTASTLAEEFVDPLEQRIGDPGSPDSIEGRLAAIEGRMSEVEDEVWGSDLTAEVEALRARTEDLEREVEALAALVSESGGAVDIWGIGQFTHRRVFNPDGTHGVSRWFPLPTEPPNALRLEFSDCRAVLLSLRVRNRIDVSDLIGLDISMNEDMSSPVRVQLEASPADATNLTQWSQLWVPNNGRDRLYVRTIPGASHPTGGLIFHTGCIR